MTVKIFLAASAATWLLVRILLHRVSRDAAWLAGSTVASCLFFLGATILVSVLVPGTLFLAPLGLGVFVLAVLHLHTAYQEPAWMNPIPQVLNDRETTDAPPPAGEHSGERSDGYIRQEKARKWPARLA
jgi:hypothetical protein